MEAEADGNRRDISRGRDARRFGMPETQANEERGPSVGSGGGVAVEAVEAGVLWRILPRSNHLWLRLPGETSN